VLFLVGTVTALTLLANQMTSFVKESLGFTIVLNDSISSSDASNLNSKLKTATYIKSVKYISKEDAIKELAVELGENPEDFLGYNPLQASMEVKVKAEYANEEKIESIANEIQGCPGVAKVTYKKDVMNSVNRNIRTISLFLSGIAILLLFVSIGLINNTIRLQIYSKRFTINTMKMVGATPWFIRKPFLIKSVVNGIIASILACIVLEGIIYYIQIAKCPQLNLMQPEIIAYTCGAIFLLGIVISFFSSLAAIGKYLHFTTDDLYYI
jgi:cell division transport system permease protein